MEIIKQITSKGKAIDVIESCVNMLQCNSAENYINLFYSKFEDRIGFEELKRLLKEHKLNLLQPNSK